MRKLRSIAIAGVAFSLLGSCNRSPSTLSSRASPQLSVNNAPRLALADGKDIWVWTSSQSKIRITSDGEEPIDSDPQLVEADLFFLRDGDLFRATGPDYKLQKALALNGPIIAYSVSKASSVIYIFQKEGQGKHILGTYDLAKRESAFEKALQGPITGRDLLVEDEVSIKWSLDGALALVVDTQLAPDTKETIWSVDRQGKTVWGPVTGRSGFWESSSKRVIYFDGDLQSWRRADISSNRTETIGETVASLNASLSPDGKFIAADTSRAWRVGTERKGCTCSLYIFDLATGTEGKLADQFVAPVWLDENTIAATVVRGCDGNECGQDAPMWVTLGKTALLDARTAARTEFPFASTLDVSSSR